MQIPEQDLNTTTRISRTFAITKYNVSSSTGLQRTSIAVQQIRIMLPSQIFQPEWQNVVIIVLGCALLGVAYLTLSHVVNPAIDPREPPVLKAHLPLIGHVVGLLQHGVDYFSILGYDQDIRPCSNLQPETCVF